ncbi:MAG: GFA family protein [Hyphomicrobiales bacterium]|nr:MAG: GFA family protein [Hyphomicrobiales bacterium]
MQITHKGGCRCGAIRFEAQPEPFYTSYCHCSDCRHASGAPVAAFVGFKTRNVVFRGFEGATYGKYPIKRSFCPTCGAPIAYRDSRIDDQIFFMLGAMDKPERYPPTVHGYVGEQLPFLHMDDGLLRLEANTAPRRQDE